MQGYNYQGQSRTRSMVITSPARIYEWKRSDRGRKRRHLIASMERQPKSDGQMDGRTDEHETFLTQSTLFVYLDSMHTKNIGQLFYFGVRTFPFFRGLNQQVILIIKYLYIGYKKTFISDRQEMIIY